MNTLAIIWAISLPIVATICLITAMQEGKMSVSDLCIYIILTAMGPVGLMVIAACQLAACSNKVIWRRK